MNKKGFSVVTKAILYLIVFVVLISIIHQMLFGRVLISLRGQVTDFLGLTFEKYVSEQNFDAMQSLIAAFERGINSEVNDCLLEYTVPYELGGGKRGYSMIFYKPDTDSIYYYIVSNEYAKALIDKNNFEYLQPDGYIRLSHKPCILDGRNFREVYPLRGEPQSHKILIIESKYLQIRTATALARAGTDIIDSSGRNYYLEYAGKNSPGFLYKTKENKICFMPYASRWVRRDSLNRNDFISINSPELRAIDFPGLLTCQEKEELRKSQEDVRLKFIKTSMTYFPFESYMALIRRGDSVSDPDMYAFSFNIDMPQSFDGSNIKNCNKIKIKNLKIYERTMGPNEVLEYEYPDDNKHVFYAYSEDIDQKKLVWEYNLYFKYYFGNIDSDQICQDIVNEEYLRDKGYIVYNKEDGFLLKNEYLLGEVSINE